MVTLSEAVAVVRLVAEGLSRVAELGKENRERTTLVVVETYTLLTEALLLMEKRLDALAHARDPEEFARIARGLGEVEDWARIEKDVYLCLPLRRRFADMQRLPQKILDAVSLANPEALNNVVRPLIDEGERGLARLIADSLRDVQDAVGTLEPGKAKELAALRRDHFAAQRRTLIQEQARLLDAI